jgi:hypothetical protein
MADLATARTLLEAAAEAIQGRSPAAWPKSTAKRCEYILTAARKVSHPSESFAGVIAPSGPSR